MKIEQIKISDIEKGPIRHTTLPQALIDRIKSFQQILSEVEDTPLEDVINDFRRDMFPEREVRIWEQIARVYEAFVSENFITDLATKREVYSVALAASMGEGGFSNIKLLSKDQIKDIICRYYPTAFDQII